MKKYLKNLCCCLGVIFGGGFLLLVAWNFFILFSMPLYVLYAVGLLGLTGLVALCLCILFGQRGRHIVKNNYLILCIVVAIYVGHGIWQDNIPTMDDRLLMLYQYQPNTSNTKAVRLEKKTTLKLDDDYFLPSMDGATALYPVYAAFAQAVYPEKEYSLYESKVVCSNTARAYQRLIDQDVDVIFVAAPSQEQKDAAKAAGMEFYLTPIGREAFVFFVNSRNPVKGLTVEQVKGIYSGAITNWNEVGGKNQSIRAFQRAQNSGSQSALERFMEDIPIAEPERKNVVIGMEGIISQVASYQNYKNAIGFSFRYYSTQMVENEQIRLLSLDGVFPTKETIRDGSYPISSEFYAVTAAPIGQPAPKMKNPRLSALLKWILSPQGQWIIEKTGYVSLN